MKTSLPLAVHGANGYLVHQFLDKSANARADEWGGSAENRSRFLLETAKELSDVWGPDRVGVKLNPPGGYNDMGMALQDTLETYSYAIQALDDMKMGYVTLVQHVPAYDLSYEEGEWPPGVNVSSPAVHTSK
jgi:2,4-dienoyl-CoA reductase-like NADH-dependent reductase (Old Yellow Enzyme family)